MAVTPFNLVNANLERTTLATAIVDPVTPIANQVYGLNYNIQWVGASGTEALAIQSGGTSPVTYAVTDKNNKPVPIGRLRRGQKLCLKFVPAVTGTTPIAAHFVLLNELCPQILVVTPPAYPALQLLPPPVLAPI